MKIMYKSNTMRQDCKTQTGQAVVETALAVPILLLLFMACSQLVQIGLAHILVARAAYESGRQCWLDQGQTQHAQQVAVKICRIASPGETRFQQQNGAYIVTHHLRAMFPVFKRMEIRHACPEYLFRTERAQ